jgi:excisionase family DNA binding protein
VSCPPLSAPLTVAEAAARSDVHRVTLLRWITTGVRGVRLAASKAGATWRVRPADLEAFLAELTRLALAGSPAPVACAGSTPAAQRERARAALDRIRNS